MDLFSRELHCDPFRSLSNRERFVDWQRESLKPWTKRLFKARHNIIKAYQPTSSECALRKGKLLLQRHTFASSQYQFLMIKGLHCNASGSFWSRFGSRHLESHRRSIFPLDCTDLPCLVFYDRNFSVTGESDWMSRWLYESFDLRTSEVGNVKAWFSQGQHHLQKSRRRLALVPMSWYIWYLGLSHQNIPYALGVWRKHIKEVYWTVDRVVKNVLDFLQRVTDTDFQVLGCIRPVQGRWIYEILGMRKILSDGAIVSQFCKPLSYGEWSAYDEAKDHRS